MKLTKYEHACFIIEGQEQGLVVDPGMFTSLSEGLPAVGLVVTHVHDDHLTDDNLNRLRTANPDLPIFTTAEVAEKVPGAIVVETNKTYDAGPFRLQFFGDKHQQVHPDYPPADNYGVFINEKVYYPGDSFTLPGKPIEVLLVPAAAPWMKTSEAMDFITAVKPHLVIPTHDDVLSNEGKGFTDNWLKQAAEKAGATYQRLSTGESIDI